ncbi:ABC transporter ATP-binding protein [Marinobacterium arenosum]|uniref:ABC transporter ATP-binding protein n=1 Tax=Marinobacterium arenosum TaxID=2862496 RepID=UPI001C97D162|nr:polyamine ABC transporter ATP-binding protein [Marinobacterium arenosum]MBY4678186.1 polyamine ABC transporter ATP-binding protein [Marinobacterium arenosum]
MTTASPIAETTDQQALFYSRSDLAQDALLAERGFIEIRAISKAFDSVLAVDNIDLQIRKGEIFALLGGSGCGKSTLLRMLSGFETPTRGDIRIDNESILAMPPHQRPTNMMFQSYALFPHMNVEKNIAYGLQQQGLSNADIGQKVDEMLRLVHMDAYRKRKPNQLSGGQRQRVALARSLARHPKVLLLDEPMGALDKKLRSQMQLELVEIIKQVGVTCVMVTHDQEEAMTMADRIAIMNQGRLVQVGTPHEVYEYPNCQFAAEFIGSVNVFDGKVYEEGPQHARIRCELLRQPILIDHGISGPAGQKLKVAVRPEKVLLSKQPPSQPDNWNSGRIMEIAYLGGHSIYHVELPTGLVVQATRSNTERRDVQYRIHDEVFIHWNADSGVVLEQ